MTERVAKEETRTTIKAIINITKTEKKLNKDKDDKPTILPRDLLTKKLIIPIMEKKIMEKAI